MKLVRPALAVSVGLAVALTGPSFAAAKKPAPKPVCGLVTDVQLDAPGLVPGNVEALDVISADIASDSKRLTAVIRVKKLATTARPASPTGMRWKFFFTAEDIVFSLGAHTDPLGVVSYDAAYTDPQLGGQLYGGGVVGKFDLTRNEVRITAETSLFAAQATIKAGTVLSDLNVTTGPEVAVPDPGGRLNGGGALLRSYPPGGDTAEGTRTYKGGTLSCVKPG